MSDSVIDKTEFSKSSQFLPTPLPSIPYIISPVVRYYSNKGQDFLLLIS